MSVFVLLLVIAVLIGAYWIYSKFKFPKVGALAVINGGVKCGKSTFAVGLAMKEFKRRVKRTKRINFFRKIFSSKKAPLPLPKLYSNIPLAVPYCEIDEDLLMRRKRFEYNSVIYVNEASLLADSKAIQDENININLLLFFKLIGHETKGGCVILDTHTIADLHYAIKRTTSEYFYIHHLTKWIPFFMIAYVQECRYSDDGSTIFAQTQDIEDTLRKVIIRKSTWKKFDSYCFSYLTDSLPVEDREKIAIDLKAKNILSFNPKLTLINNNLKKEQNNDL